MMCHFRSKEHLSPIQRIEKGFWNAQLSYRFYSKVYKEPLTVIYRDDIIKE